MARPSSRVRGIWGSVLFLGVTSCSGGGCGGCAVPGATTLPGGYPVGQAVPGAGALRITRAGLDVLGASVSTVATGLTGLVGDGGADGGSSAALSFVVPTSTTSGSFDVLGVPVPYSLAVCPSGADANATPPTCRVDARLPAGSLHLDAVAPDALTLSGTVPIRLRDLPIDASLVGAVSLGFGQGACNGATPEFDYGSFPVSVTLPLVAETVAPRAGITKVDAADAVVTISADPSALGVCGECAPGDLVCEAVLGTIEELAFPLILDQVEAQVKSALAPSFCTIPDTTVTPSCPTGSSAGTGTNGSPACLYDSAPKACVPVFFGTDGKLAPSALLGSSFVPASAAPLDFVLAAGGALDPAPGAAADAQGYAGHTPNGATFSLLGGVNAVTVSPCVPPIDLVAPTGLPLPAALTVDTVAGWPSGTPGPHVGMAFAARYLDYALARTYQSGALCLEVSTADVSALSTGLLSLLVPSLPSLTFEGSAAAIQVRVRPGVPPTVTVGSGADTGANSILTVHAPSMAFDFYVFSDDEYVRAFTFTADATIPLSITTGKTKANPNGGLAPVVGQIGFANPVVTSSELLSDSPASIASGVELALSVVVGQLFTSLPGIDPSAALASFGLTIDVPSSGIQKVTEGSDDFLAVFAALAPATTTVGKAPVGTTHLSLTRLAVDPAGLGLLDATRDRLPTLAVQLSPADARPREYAWWIDDGPRSAWSTDAAPEIRSDALYFQGKHVLSVATRLPGDTASEAEPSTLPFVLDVLAPSVSFDGSLQAWDIVSPTTALQARWQASGSGAWSTWSALAETKAASLSGGASVEVRDEAGNVASLVVPASGGSAVAGASSTDGGSGGCSIGGDDSARSADAAWLLLAALGALLVGRRARRTGSRTTIARAASVGLLATGATSATVGCGGDNLESTSHDAGAADASVHGCGSDCLQPCLPALDQGVVGAYASLAESSSAADGGNGTVWVAAYSDAVITGATRVPYGDLVVGTYAAATGSVAWQTVDGVPARTSATCPDHDPTGWRGGETAAGDDVGLFTSLATDASGEPMVAYFDATHGTLKFARFDGSHWAVHSVTGSGDGGPSVDGVERGRYAQLAIVAGVPTISYLAQDASAGTSRVEIATATTATPASAADWSLSIVAAAPGATDAAHGHGHQRRAQRAAGRLRRLRQRRQRQPGRLRRRDRLLRSAGREPGRSDAERGRGQRLEHARPCRRLAEGGRPRRRCRARAWSSSARPTPAPAATGTSSTSTRRPGSWSTSTSSAARRRELPSVIDDGSAVGGQSFPDGVHLVGAGAKLTLDATGAPRVYYGDATAGTLRVASGSRTGSGVIRGIQMDTQRRPAGGALRRPVPASPARKQQGRQRLPQRRRGRRDPRRLRLRRRLRSRRRSIRNSGYDARRSWKRAPRSPSRTAGPAVRVRSSETMARSDARLSTPLISSARM